LLNPTFCGSYIAQLAVFFTTVILPVWNRWKRLDRFRYVRAAELIIDFRRDAFCCAIDHQPNGKGILANFDDINGAVHRG
jgi:hypothetical protein